MQDSENGHLFLLFHHLYNRKTKKTSNLPLGAALLQCLATNFVQSSDLITQMIYIYMGVQPKTFLFIGAVLGA